MSIDFPFLNTDKKVNTNIAECQTKNVQDILNSIKMVWSANAFNKTNIDLQNIEHLLVEKGDRMLQFSALLGKSKEGYVYAKLGIIPASKKTLLSFDFVNVLDKPAEEVGTFLQESLTSLKEFHFAYRHLIKAWWNAAEYCGLDTSCKEKFRSVNQISSTNNLFVWTTGKSRLLTPLGVLETEPDVGFIDMWSDIRNGSSKTPTYDILKYFGLDIVKNSSSIDIDMHSPEVMSALVVSILKGENFCR